MTALRDTAEARSLLLAHGADHIAHPGGTLLAHLERVHDLLFAWDARPALQLAGLCHAFYGTDGFPTALAPPHQREHLVAVIGDEAEAIVHRYCSCDRAATYPALTQTPVEFRDRFTNTTTIPSEPDTRDFAELTAANELDLVLIGAVPGHVVAQLLQQLQAWLSPPAQHASATAGR